MPTPKLNSHCGTKSTSSREITAAAAHARIKSSQWAVAGIVLEPSCDFFREVATDLQVGRELHTSVHSGSVKRPVRRGIEAPVPSTELAVYNCIPRPAPMTLPRPARFAPDSASPCPVFVTALHHCPSFLDGRRERESPTTPPVKIVLDWELGQIGSVEPQINWSTHPSSTAAASFCPFVVGRRRMCVRGASDGRRDRF